MNQEIAPAASPGNRSFRFGPRIWMALAALLCVAIYWPGLSGGFLFDDYPNIVDNKALQIDSLSWHALAQAAWSSKSSDLKRPLSSISFALDYAAHGLSPYWMKMTNVIIHVLNGLVLFWLVRLLASQAAIKYSPRRAQWLGAFVAAAWLLLPINLTAVLYVVQRMESLANLFVLLGLAGYVSGRQTMKEQRAGGATTAILSIAGGTLLGLGAKETAALLPLYACCIEWFVLGGFSSKAPNERKFVWLTFTILLAMPLIIGLAVIIPKLLSPNAWANRDFTLAERLLTEPRIVLSYIYWTLLPTPSNLSFYHDDIAKSPGLLSPITTLLSLAGLLALGICAFILRRKNALFSLGLALFLCAQSLTATIIPLELVFEHRNYFASSGLMLSLGSLIVRPDESNSAGSDRIKFIVAAALMSFWAAQTAMTAHAWSSPIQFAVEMAQRAPQSSRAQYRLGATLVEASKFDPHSASFALGRAALERSATLPGASTLGDQALILMACRTGLPMEENWWNRLFKKLKDHRPRAEDISSIMALTAKDTSGECTLPTDQMLRMFQIALSHPRPSANVLAAYADFAWHSLNDKQLAARVAMDAAAADPGNAQRQSTAIIMLAGSGQPEEAATDLTKVIARTPGIFSDEELSSLRKLISTVQSGQEH